MRPEAGRRRRGGLRGRLSHSLFLKLLLVLAAAAVLVNLCVGGFFRLMFSHRAHAALRQNLTHYAEYMARDIGNPPDTARARTLARDHSLDILYRGPSGAWSTSAEAAALSDARQRFPHGPGCAAEDSLCAMGWSRGRYFVEVERGGAKYLFATAFRQSVEARWPFVMGLLGMVSAILIGTWLAIRRLLRPLRDLTEAVEGLGNGDLGRQVREQGRRDELGELARAFNAMSTRLQGMVRSREQLLLDVSHELRSPLTRIKVALEMSPEGGAKESIGDDLGEMEAMIGEILEAARLDSPAGGLKRETVDLDALVEEAARAFEGSAPEVTVTLPRGSPGAGSPFRVEADRERVRKVLSNVIGNAVKYSRPGGAPVEVSLEGRDGEAAILVRDRGLGIPAEEIPRLFEPFYRVDRSRSRDTGGYGLGLSLCKRIMEAHGGRIRIESGEGKGTVVYLYFPTP